MSSQSRRKAGWFASWLLAATCLLFFLAATRVYAGASTLLTFQRAIHSGQSVGQETALTPANSPQSPPATYYGLLQAGLGFSPTVGMTVTAWITENLCGQGKVLGIDDQTVYNINVLADGPGGVTGCGALGRAVTFQVGSQVMTPTVEWDNSRLWELALYASVQAGFTVSPTCGTRPLAVTFTDRSIGSYTALQWDFGDGETRTARHPTHTYALTGTFTVSLTVSGPGGSDTEVKADYIRVSEPITASFTADPTSGLAPLTVQFTDESAGNITSWQWDFGDGEISAAQHPIHTYAFQGTFTVSLIVGGLGVSNVETKAEYITVWKKYSVYLPIVIREFIFRSP